MLENHAKVMAMLKSAGEIIGRKKLQKMIFIAKKMQFPFYERFRFHMYGPYSEELTLRMEELCNLGLVEEKNEKKGGYYQYSYRLTQEGETFLDNYEWDMPLFDQCVQSLNGESARFLELVSTMLYFDHLAHDEMVKKVAAVKKSQHYSDEEFRAASAYIASLQSLVRSETFQR